MSKVKYRKILICILVFVTMFSGIYYIEYLRDKIPDNLYVEPYKEDNIDLNVPFIGTIDVYCNEEEIAAASVNLMDSIYMAGNAEQTYTASVRLFGLFEIKKVEVHVEEQQEIIAYGMPIGIHLETSGVLVVDTGNIASGEGEIESPAKGNLKSGDYILSVNGKKVINKSELIELIQNTNDIVCLEVKRDNEIINVKIKPVTDENGMSKIGVWVRDDCQGLGTLTYVDRNMGFGALGHAICEENTGAVVDIKDGYIYTAKIWSIIKGKRGNPGEVVGSINYGEKSLLGEINKNCSNGIYGQADESILAYVDNVYLKAAYKQDVKKGKAYIRTFVSGVISDYEIYIYDLTFSEKEKNKGIVFEITDSNLLNITNGIVQGMSGSPIIQDGKVIGAVTHVFVNEPDKGYGIFIENMLEE